MDYRQSPKDIILDVYSCILANRLIFSAFTDFITNPRDLFSKFIPWYLDIHLQLVIKHLIDYGFGARCLGIPHKLVGTTV